jgi:hypothetical protein
MQDSNPRPSVYKTAALPTELIRRLGAPMATRRPRGKLYDPFTLEGALSHCRDFAR